MARYSLYIDDVQKTIDISGKIEEEQRLVRMNFRMRYLNS